MVRPFYNGFAVGSDVWCRPLVPSTGKKNKLRVYYLSWLRNRILHNDPEVEKKQGWITVGDLEGCVHYKVGTSTLWKQDTADTEVSERRISATGGPSVWESDLFDIVCLVEHMAGSSVPIMSSSRRGPILVKYRTSTDLRTKLR